MKRFPKIEVTGEPERIYSTFVRGYRTLPVRIPRTTLMKRADVLIVGAGHAGAQTAIGLRNAKFAGSIALVSDEPELPYERPPLSKDYLAGEKPFERLLIRQPQFWVEREHRRDHGTARGLRRPAPPSGCEAPTVQSSSMARWCGRPAAVRVCSRAPAAISTACTACEADADVDRIVAGLPGVRRVVVIGGGYIGLEAAAVLSKLGKAVTLLEALPRVLARVAGEDISRFFEAEHRAHGVEVRTGVAIERIEGAQGRVTGVRLAGGRALRRGHGHRRRGHRPAIERVERRRRGMRQRRPCR